MIFNTNKQSIGLNVVLICISTIQYHNRNTYLITNVIRSSMTCEYFDMRHAVNIYALQL